MTYWHEELLRNGVNARVLQQLGTIVVGDWDGGVAFERTVARIAYALWEIFAFVNVFEERAHCVDIFIWKVHSSRLLRGNALVLALCRAQRERTPPSNSAHLCSK